MEHDDVVLIVSTLGTITAGLAAILDNEITPEQKKHISVQLTHISGMLAEMIVADLITDKLSEIELEKLFSKKGEKE